MRGFDIHHFHSAEPLLMAGSVLSGDACRVYTHRGGITDYSPKKRLQYRLVGRLMRRFFQGVSGNTRHAGLCAAGLFGMDRRKFRVTYNGLDFDLLEPQRTPEQVRAALGVSAADFLLGTAAHLRAWKRIDRLLRALTSLEDIPVRLLVIGDGPDRIRLERVAEELGVRGLVSFVGVQDNVGDFLQTLNAFCLPSTALESFGNAAVEAMAFGVPTIVFGDGGGLIEHVEDGKTGFVVADQQELVGTIRALAEDRHGGCLIGASGAAAVRQRYTLASAASAYRDLYASALRARVGDADTKWGVDEG
jgi:glycosyltransferase involved in cell wall biosynthesis